MKKKLVKLAIQTLKRRIDRGILIIKWVLITMLLELKRTHNCFNFRAWHFPPISYISCPKNLCFWSFPNGVLGNIWTFGIQNLDSWYIHTSNSHVFGSNFVLFMGARIVV
jgi:hypothetical protein